MQSVNKFDLGFSFFELQGNALSLNGANKNYFEELIYNHIFSFALSQNLIGDEEFLMPLFEVFLELFYDS